jgi:hypothetical protein
MLIDSFWNGNDGQTPRGRVGLFECECGCRQTFFAGYKTRYPRYANRTHRQRAYRARARARIRAADYIRKDQICNAEYWPEVYSEILVEEMSRHRVY